MSSPVDQDLVARRWHERGFSCGLWVDPPGQVWENYIHDVDELVLVVQGDVEFEVEEVVRRPHPGEELVIPGGARWLFGYKR